MSAICSGVLPCAEHDLGEARPQVAVRVDARELERAKWKLAKLLQRLGDRHALVAHFLEERLQTFRIHDAVATIQHGRRAGGSAVAPARSAGMRLPEQTIVADRPAARSDYSG